MDKGGVLLYKCRLCGCVERNPHVPDVFTAVGHLAVGLELPSSWFGSPACLMHPHFCSGGHIGVADFIGGEHDKVEPKKEGVTQGKDMTVEQSNPSLSEIFTAQRLALEAIQTDGAHHKQWYLVKILKALHMDKEDIQREIGGNEYTFDEWGIAP